MNRLLVYPFRAVVCLFFMMATPAFAQQATAVGVGVGVSKSDSSSAATAISGQGGSVNGGSATGASVTGSATGGSATGGQGGRGGKGGGAIAVINTPAADPNGSKLSETLTTQGGTVSTLRNTGTSSVRNVPSVFAPGLSAAGLETCLGSISAGGSGVGFGLTFATTLKDPDCSARLDARTLWSFGLKKAAIARLCLTTEVQRSMPEVCAEYLPQVSSTGAVAPVALKPETGEELVEPVYNGGPVDVIERKTGLLRTCKRYDVSRQRCLAWASRHLAASR